MGSNMMPSLRTIAFFRIVLLILLVCVPLITHWSNNFQALYAVTYIFLGISFWNLPKRYLIGSCSFGFFIQFINASTQQSAASILVNIFIYLIIAFLAHTVTNQYHNIKKLKKELILALSSSLDSRDKYTNHHSENVARYAVLIAKRLNFSKEACEAIYIGGLLHDIGKIGITERILTKPTRLTEKEFQHIKQHPIIGHNTLKKVASIAEMGVLDMVLYHHEHFDGSGYPNGLKGNDIPIVARIMCVADSFDAMTTNRSYKKAMSLNQALNEIKINSGTQFDPIIADIFIHILQEQKQEIQAINPHLVTTPKRLKYVLAKERKKYIPSFNENS